MTEVTGTAVCHCPHCDKEFESEVTIEVEQEDMRNDLD